MVRPGNDTAAEARTRASNVSATSFAVPHARESREFKPRAVEILENLPTNSAEEAKNEREENDQSGLASAILLGAREEIDYEQTEAFMQTGTVHILSISGTHVGILAAAAFAAMRLLLVPRVWSAVFVGLLTLLYTIVTDAEPPAVRATILVLAVLAGSGLGRRAMGFNSLAAAALIVLAMNPADLFRTGVQLSFLCVAGLMRFPSRLRGTSAVPQALLELALRNRPWPVRQASKATSGPWSWRSMGRCSGC